METIELNTNLIPLFTGTYENPLWEITEYNEEGTEEVEIDYNFKEFMQSIVEVYQSNADYILSELNCSFIKKLSFDGTFYSPREYNFSTDSLDFTVEVDNSELFKTLDSLEANEEFTKFLHDNYTSYDGFISFTPNNFKELRNEIVTVGNEYIQSIAAVITFLAKDNLELHGGVSIEEMVAEDWQCNGYRGLNYTIADNTLNL